MHEPLIAGNWLQARLETDPDLFPPDPNTPALISGVFRRAAPQNAALPFIVWQWQGSDDENAAGGAAYSVPFLVVKVVSDDRMDSTNVEAALNRLDEILTGAHDYVRTGEAPPYRWYSIGVQRAGTIDYAEDGEATFHYVHQGRLWAIGVVECNDPGLAG